MFRHVDLCSGIGGFALGFEWAELSRPVLFCDIEEWSRKILRKHWPDVPIAEDVKVLANDPDELVPDCEILTAGYPCQPFSVAGARRGTEDDRHIWPEIFSIIKAKRPTWTVFENVYGHVTLGLDEVLSDLEGQGYATRPFIVPAIAVDAPHRRDRVWIIGRNMGNAKHDGSSTAKIRGSSQEASHNSTQRQKEASEPQRASKPRHSESLETGTRTQSVGDTDSQQRRAAQKDKWLDLDRAVLDRRQGREEANTAKRSGGDMANADSVNWRPLQEPQGRQEESSIERQSTSDSRSDVANAQSQGLENVGRCSELEGKQHWRHLPKKGSSRNGRNVWLSEPPVGRVVNGLPGRVDRLRGLGNAIVPQIAQMIGETIKKTPV